MYDTDYEILNTLREQTRFATAAIPSIMFWNGA